MYINNVYMYLVARGHNPYSVQAAFDHVRKMSITQARAKVEGSGKTDKVIFVTKHNPVGPNVRAIIKKHSHILNMLHYQHKQH